MDDKMTTDRVSNELLPCPFCGSEATLVHGATDDYQIVCRSRKCFGPVTSGYAFSSDAIAAWNSRSPVAVSDGLAGDALFVTIQDAYLRGLDWGRKYGSTEAEELKASYDYADKTTAALVPADEEGQ